MNVDYICATCGSDDIRFDAWASWDPVNQRMELVWWGDETHCEKCGDRRAVDEVKYTVNDKEK